MPGGREIALVVDEMIEAAERIASWVDNVDLDGFESDMKLRSAVERQLEIISEASRSIPDSWKSERPDLMWLEMTRLGNILRHRYFSIDPLTIWRIATLDVPALRVVLEVWRAARATS